MEDDRIQQRATVADPSFAIFTALRRLVNTKAGNALAPAYEQMKTIVKNRPRKTRSRKTATTTGTVASTATTPAIVSTPAPVIAAKPAATTSASTSN